MRKRQGLLAVLALLFIVILGGCGGGDTTLSDLERTAEQFNAALQTPMRPIPSAPAALSGSVT